VVCGFDTDSECFSIQYNSFHLDVQRHVSGSKLCEVLTPPPESGHSTQASVKAFAGKRFCLLVNAELSKYLGCIAFLVPVGDHLSSLRHLSNLHLDSVFIGTTKDLVIGMLLLKIPRKIAQNQ
jgi:hypothetical protein